jgi:hypothetical protein
MILACRMFRPRKPRDSTGIAVEVDFNRQVLQLPARKFG